MASPPEHLADFARDTFLVLRAGLEDEGGHAFQELIGQIARRIRGSVYIQGSGLPTMFGRRGASGLGHEVDASLQHTTWMAMVEAKSLLMGPGKNDVLIFDGKTFDLYVDRLLRNRRGPHYRLLVSRSPVRSGVAAYCAQRAIVCVSPDLMPLPVLLALIGRPVANDLFSDMEMEEADRLFRRACCSMEELWRPRGRQLLLGIRRFESAFADDLTFLQRQMSNRATDYMDEREPGWAEHRAKVIVSRLAHLPQLKRAV